MSFFISGNLIWIITCFRIQLDLFSFSCEKPIIVTVKKSFSIVLAFLLLFANIGLAKSSHICMGSEMLNAIGLSAKNLDCGMKHQSESPSSDQGGLSNADECCQNSFELVHNDSDQNLKIVHLDAAQLIFVAAFTQVFIFGIDPVTSTEYSNVFISPPAIDKDYTVLFQSFLI